LLPLFFIHLLEYVLKPAIVIVNTTLHTLKLEADGIYQRGSIVHMNLGKKQQLEQRKKDHLPSYFLRIVFLVLK
jgi:hypothetical protein